MRSTYFSISQGVFVPGDDTSDESESENEEDDLPLWRKSIFDF